MQYLGMKLTAHIKWFLQGTCGHLAASRLILSADTGRARRTAPYSPGIGTAIEYRAARAVT
jgi:hypothetical protein